VNNNGSNLVNHIDPFRVKFYSIIKIKKINFLLNLNQIPEPINDTVINTNNRIFCKKCGGGDHKTAGSKKCKFYRIVTNNSATNVTFETGTNVNIETGTNVTFETGTYVNIESTTNVNHALIDLTPFQQPTIRINEPAPNSEVNTKNE
jgi:hypothetical protein